MCIVDLSVPFYKNSVWPSIIKTILGLKDKGVDILAQCKKKSFQWRPLCGVESKQEGVLGSLLLSVSLTPMEDRLMWTLSSLGDFSIGSVGTLVNSCTLLLTDIATQWVSLLPIKVSIFAWKLVLDRLPTRLNISRGGLDISSLLCPIYNSGVDSINHLFFSCLVALMLLEKTLEWWGLNCLVISSYVEWVLWFIISSYVE
ncbi:uncharacterized protein LOC111880260 [Lactuca sativa]|nr:uncharacterized protein LOC111880260 [Lactuca sativa]